MSHISAILGLISGLFLALPAIRQLLSHRKYDKFKKAGSFPDDRPKSQLEIAAERYMLRELISLSKPDAWCTVLGCVFLFAALAAESMVKG
jgi:hypothetical protein